MSIETLLPFIFEIDKLKNIERQTLIHAGTRRENSAEHSWHLAMAVLVYAASEKIELDVFKAVKMALLHDIVEVYAGDVIIYGDQSNKKIDEAAALENLLKLLPLTIAEEFATVWREFEDGESEEAKFVAALDRFLPLYSNFLNGGHSWANHNVKRDKVIEKCRPVIERSLPGLWEVSRRMIDESVANGNLKA